ncbi:MAG TPA: hypothetical protein H9745_06390 [Candidatus Agathobaculum stercoravium]|nr:hypothetical protein [Candidatus Agathobaculum stercoravium]
MPSLGQIMAGAIAGVASGAANAIKNSNKNKGSSSSGSSGGNKGSSSGGSSGGSSSGVFNGSAADYDRLQQQANQYAQQWHQADTQEEKDKLHDLATIVNQQLGKTYDDSTGVWSGGYARPEEAPSYTEQLQTGYDRYNDYMQQAADQQQAAIQAGVDSAVANLNAQRPQIDKLTQQNNAAAEKAYMQTINPNGSLAENLAANGLLPTGVTETSQIQAGNAYQTALNSNAQTQTEAIAELERAITQAQLTGDIEAANAYAQVLQEIAQMGYQNAQDIIAAGQWQQQFDYNKGVTDAGLTGVYNGVPTMEAQRLELEKQQYEDQRQQLQQQLQLGQIDIETAQKQLELLDREISRADEEITSLKLQNRYYETQL